jgi:hypothetical protein
MLPIAAASRTEALLALLRMLVSPRTLGMAVETDLMFFTRRTVGTTETATPAAALATMVEVSTPSIAVLVLPEAFPQLRTGRPSAIAKDARLLCFMSNHGSGFLLAYWLPIWMPLSPRVTNRLRRSAALAVSIAETPAVHRSPHKMVGESIGCKAIAGGFPWMMIRFCSHLWCAKMTASHLPRLPLRDQTLTVSRCFWRAKICTLISVFLA